MGATVKPSDIRGVHFVKQNVTETMREVWGETGVTFLGRVPPKVKVGDPLVVHPNEGETWWLSVQGCDEDLKSGVVHTQMHMIRVQSEVEYTKCETEKALLDFVTVEFPSPSYSVEKVPSSYGVTLRVTGPVRTLPYGSGGKLTPKWLDRVLGDIPHDRDGNHPYVSGIKIKSVTGGYDIVASIT